MIKQFGGSGYESSEVMVIDEVEMQMHHQLEKLYRSTRSGRVIIFFLLISVLGVLLLFSCENSNYIRIIQGMPSMQSYI